MRNDTFKKLTVGDVENMLNEIYVKGKPSYLYDIALDKNNGLTDQSILKEFKNGKKKTK